VKPLNVEKPPNKPVIQNNLAVSDSILYHKKPIKKTSGCVDEKSRPRKVMRLKRDSQSDSPSQY
jgi:hypothetical protein